jgi:hypothetical protein
VAAVHAADIRVDVGDLGVEQRRVGGVADVDGGDAGVLLGRGDDEEVSDGVERAGADAAELGGREAGDDHRVLRVGGVDDVEPRVGAADVDEGALPAEAPDGVGVVAVVDALELERAQQRRRRGVGEVPEVDAAAGDRGEERLAVGGARGGHGVGLGLALGVRAQKLRDEDWREGVGDVPELVGAVAGEQQVAVDHRGLVVGLGAELRADDLAEQIGGVGLIRQHPAGGVGGGGERRDQERCAEAELGHGAQCLSPRGWTQCRRSSARH